MIRTTHCMCPRYQLPDNQPTDLWTALFFCILN